MQDKSLLDERTVLVKHKWVVHWSRDGLICAICTRPQTVDNNDETCYSRSLNIEQKDLGAEYKRILAALIKYGSHRDCSKTYGHDCDCGFEKFQKEFHIARVGRG